MRTVSLVFACCLWASSMLLTIAVMGCGGGAAVGGQGMSTDRSTLPQLDSPPPPPVEVPEEPVAAPDPYGEIDTPPPVPFYDTGGGDAPEPALPGLPY